MTKAAPGEVINKIRALTARPEGVNRKEVCEVMQMSSSTASSYISVLVRNKEAHKAGVHGELRYFKDIEKAVEFDQIKEADRIRRAKEARQRESARKLIKQREEREARKKTPKPVQPRIAKLLARIPAAQDIVIESKQGALDKKRIHANAVITWPDNVKVQVLPGYAGEKRFKPDPSHTGSFIAEWKEKRAA